MRLTRGSWADEQFEARARLSEADRALFPLGSGVRVRVGAYAYYACNEHHLVLKFTQTLSHIPIHVPIYPPMQIAPQLNSAAGPSVAESIRPSSVHENENTLGHHLPVSTKSPVTNDN